MDFKVYIVVKLYKNGGEVRVSFATPYNAFTIHIEAALEYEIPELKSTNLLPSECILNGL